MTRLALLASLSLYSASALAGPGYIPIQGVLADDAGVAIDGQVDVTFTLYTDSGGSTSLWTDTLTLDVVDGRFATELGAGTQLDLASFASYPTVHLGIQVAGDTAMPLVPLDHVPYAAWAEKAGDADTLGGATVGDLRAEIPAVSDIEAAAQGAAYDTEAELTAVLDDNYLPASYTPDWTDLTNRPAGLDDGDDGFTTEGELTALLDDNYLSAAYVPDWSDLANRPAGLDDGDDGFTTEGELTALLDDNYAGTVTDGLTLSNGTLSLDVSTGMTRAPGEEIFAGRRVIATKVASVSMSETAPTAVTSRGFCANDGCAGLPTAPAGTARTARFVVTYSDTIGSCSDATGNSQGVHWELVRDLNDGNQADDPAIKQWDFSRTYSGAGLTHARATASFPVSDLDVCATSWGTTCRLHVYAPSGCNGTSLRVDEIAVEYFDVVQ